MDRKDGSVGSSFPELSGDNDYDNSLTRELLFVNFRHPAARRTRYLPVRTGPGRMPARKSQECLDGFRNYVVDVV
jgi:hypothetical protein